MKKQMIEGFRLAIEWGNPYTEPPDGSPAVLIEMYIITSNACPPMPDEFKAYSILGTGYGFTVRYIGPPPRSLPVDTLSKVRRKRLERRINKKYPLFHDQFIEEEISNKADYYDGITDPDIKKDYDDAVFAVQKEYEKLLEIGVRI